MKTINLGTTIEDGQIATIAEIIMSVPPATKWRNRAGQVGNGPAMLRAIYMIPGANEARWFKRTLATSIKVVDRDGKPGKNNVWIEAVCATCDGLGTVSCGSHDRICDCVAGAEEPAVDPAIAQCTNDASCPNAYTGGDHCCSVSEANAAQLEDDDDDDDFCDEHCAECGENFDDCTCDDDEDDDGAEEVSEALMALLEDHGEDLLDGEHGVVESYEHAGIMSDDAGFVMTIGDRQYQVTIVRSN